MSHFAHSVDENVDFSVDFAHPALPQSSGNSFDWEGLCAEPLRHTKSSNAVFSSHERFFQLGVPQLSRSRSEYNSQGFRGDFETDLLSQTASASQFPGGKSVSTAFADPLNNYILSEDTPWVGLAAAPARLCRNTVHSQSIQPDLDSYPYRNLLLSDINIAQDSGYGGSLHPTSRSVKSAGEYSRCASDLSGASPSLLNNSRLTLMPEPSPSAQSVLEDGQAVKSYKRTKGSGERKCERCGVTLKCPSDYRKHMLKHDKPNRCNVADCQRTEGFSTINDLQRHMKSKHNILNDTVTRSWKCVVPGCKTADKIWPRRDNFKQHIIRMHKIDNVKDLIARSEIAGLAGPGAKSTIDADLAGMNNSPGYLEDAAYMITPGDLDLEGSGPRPEDIAEWDNPIHNHNNLPKVDAQGYSHHSNRQVLHDAFNRSTAQSSSSTNLHALANVALASPDNTTNNVHSPNYHRTSGSRERDHSSPPHHLARSDIDSSFNCKSSCKEEVRDMRHFIKAASREKRREMLVGLRDLDPDLTAEVESVQSPQSTTLGKGEKHRCRWCNKGFKTQSALSKHDRRHTKPWACTHLGCDKSFGSKSDWKRHEQHQHNSLELWVCQVPNHALSSQPCGEKKWDQKRFIEHLKAHHLTHTLKDQDEWILKSRIDYSAQWHNTTYQQNFWCGFCQKVITAENPPSEIPTVAEVNLRDTIKERTKQMRVDSINEQKRHDHIGRHFQVEGRKMNTWTYWETNKTAAELSTAGPLNEAQFVLDQLEDTVPPTSTATTPELAYSSPVSEHSSLNSAARNDKKRKGSGNVNRESRKVKCIAAKHWECCRCRQVLTRAIHADCFDCGHDCEKSGCLIGSTIALAEGPHDSVGYYSSSAKIKDKVDGKGSVWRPNT